MEKSLKEIKRTVDDLGRVALPKDFRRLLGIEEGNEVKIILTMDGIVIKKEYTKSQDKC